MDYFWFADRFGWTKPEVDAQPVLHLRRLMLIGQVRDEVREDQRRAQEREAG